MIQYDVETTGLQAWSGKQRAFMFQFGDDTGLVEVLDPDKDKERIQEWFDRGKLEGIMAHNTKFDRSFGYIAGFDIPPDGCWHDSMVIAHAINENRSLALKNIATELLGPGADDLQKEVKDWLTAERRRRKSEALKTKTELVEPNYSDVPHDLMTEYAAEDIVLTRKVYENYKPIVERTPDIKGIVEFENQVLDALWHVERRGFPVNELGYRRLEVEVLENIEDLEDKCLSLAAEADIEDFNPKSTANILAALRAREADMGFMNKKDGKIVSADAENLSLVDDELAAAILEFRAEFKALSTYIRPMIARSHVPAMRMYKEPFIATDGRIHPNFRQVGTITGRMSCSDPNLQNQPRDDLRLRYNFVAPEGYKLVTCDLSNVEMRVFAAYAGEGALLNTIREGGDIHELTAEMIGIRDRKRAGGTVETARQRGKTFNFSIVYGGGIKTIKKQQRVSDDEARRMLQRYKDTYPEVVRLQNKIAWKLQDTGYIKSAWGRRFHVDPRDSYKAVNYLVQGTSADLLKAALIRLHAEGVPVIGLVHDEIVACVPEAEAEETKAKIIAALIEHPRITDKVPLEAEGDIVDHWSDAKLLKDEDGRKYMFTPRWDGGQKRYV